jgi:hypothetical protein
MMLDFIFNEIKANSDLQADSTLNYFYTSNQNTAHGILNSVNDAIENFNYGQAASLNNSFNPANIIEQNQQGFNTIYLNHIDSIQTYTATEANDLNTIAKQCAIIGGNAVYQSRNLLMSIANNFIDFGDSCDVTNNTSYVRDRSMETEMAANTITNDNGLKSIKIYPNPSTGKITLECNLQDNESGILLLYNLTGKFVASYKLPQGSKTLPVNAEKLQSGIYQYEVIINGKTVKKDKLTIIK